MLSRCSNYFSRYWFPLVGISRRDLLYRHLAFYSVPSHIIRFLYSDRYTPFTPLPQTQPHTVGFRPPLPRPRLVNPNPAGLPYSIVFSVRHFTSSLPTLNETLVIKMHLPSSFDAIYILMCIRS